MVLDETLVTNWVTLPTFGPKISSSPAVRPWDPLAIEKAATTHKRQHGVYYTPIEVAKTLSEWAIRSDSDSVLEPSFGGCAFLETCLDQLKAVGCKQPEAKLYGYDIDPLAFVHLHELSNDLHKSGRFILGDFLAAGADEIASQKVNVVLGNPPFVPYRKMNAAQRKSLNDWISKNRNVVVRDASLWAYFVQNSLKFLHEDGRMAWVLPSSLLFVEYGESLLELLKSHFKTTTVVKVQEQLFVSTGTRERTVLLLCDGYSSTPSYEGNCSIVQVTKFRDWSNSLQLSTNHHSGTEKIHINQPLDRAYELITDCLSTNNYTTLGDISKILIGDVIGDSAFFVKTVNEWNEIGIEQKHLKPLLSKSSFYQGCDLTATEIKKMIEKPHKCLLLHPIENKVPIEVQKYLDTYNFDKRENNATFKRRQPWYLCSNDTSADIFFPSVSTIGPRMIVNSGGIACSNSLYRIHLVPTWKSKKFALALFNTSSFSQLVAELVGGTMGEGALKLNPLHVKQLPIFTALSDLNATAYTAFRAMSHKLLDGHEEGARAIADAWLTPVLTESMTNKLRIVLTTLRSRRINYKC